MREKMATNQQQIAALLKALISKGVETKDAIPTIKKLIEAKIFTLADLNTSNIPPSIDAKIQSKILSTDRTKRSFPPSSHGDSPSKRSKSTSYTTIVQPPVTSKPVSILINRSPVLTLWATIVAMKLHAQLTLPEALTFGSAVSALTAKAKGTSLGIYQAVDRAGNPHLDQDDVQLLTILGVDVLAKRVNGGDGLLFAMVNGQTQNPTKIWSLLSNKFQDSLGFVMNKMQIAASNARDDLESTAYRYYMHIRPDIPHGTKGWGAHGHFETEKLSNFYIVTAHTQDGENASAKSEDSNNEKIPATEK